MQGESGSYVSIWGRKSCSSCKSSCFITAGKKSCFFTVPEKVLCKDVSLGKNGSLINLACERRRASEIGIADSCNDLGVMAWAVAPELV